LAIPGSIDLWAQADFRIMNQPVQVGVDEEEAPC
jgi:hypothetical protein